MVISRRVVLLRFAVDLEYYRLFLLSFCHFVKKCYCVQFILKKSTIQFGDYIVNKKIIHIKNN